MKIGILLDQIAPGSAPRILGAEVGYLKQMQHEAEGISIIDNRYRFSDFLGNINVRFLDCEFPKIFDLFRFKFPFFSFFSAFHLTSSLLAPAVFRRKEYDVLVAHATYTCFLAKALARRKNIPYFAFIWDPISYILPKVYPIDSFLGHFFPILLPMGRYFDNYLVEDSLAIITCSHFHIPLLEKLTGKNIEVVYPGCDPLKSIPEKRGDYILALDRWDIGNTPNKILDVLERLPQEAKLLVVGYWCPESLRINFLKEVKNRNLSERVEVRGPADKKEVKRLFSEARALIHPNEEVFGFVSHEAASCGCPILMPKTSGNTEIYKHGEHGFFTDGWNVSEFADYLTRLVNDERLAWEMGHNAWMVAQHYTWKDHAVSLEKVIRKYVG